MAKGKKRKKIVSETPLGGGLYIRQYEPQSELERIVFGGVGEIKFIHKKRK